MIDTKQLESLSYKPTIAELEGILERDGVGAIEIMPNGEIKARETKCPNCGHEWAIHKYNPELRINKVKDAGQNLRNGVNLEKLNIHTVPNGRGGHKLVAGKSSESPNQQLITEIEGLLSQVSQKIHGLNYDNIHQDRTIKSKALEEID